MSNHDHWLTRLKESDAATRSQEPQGEPFNPAVYREPTLRENVSVYLHDSLKWALKFAGVMMHRAQRHPAVAFMGYGKQVVSATVHGVTQRAHASLPWIRSFCYDQSYGNHRVAIVGAVMLTAMTLFGQKPPVSADSTKKPESSLATIDRQRVKAERGNK